jgi:hypothetical protein
VKQFIAEHQQQISGVLSGFDRLVLRGTLRRIAHAEGMNHYLWANDVLLKDFAAHVESVSQGLEVSLDGRNASRWPPRPLPVLARCK